MSSIFKSQRFSGVETFKRDFDSAILIDCEFDDYQLEGARLGDAVFVGCTFKKVDFYWASMFCTKFIRCRLEEVDFRGANMAETVFADCRLIRCDFSPDNLGADTDLAPATFWETEQIDCAYKKSERA